MYVIDQRSTRDNAKGCVGGKKTFLQHVCLLCQDRRHSRNVRQTDRMEPRKVHANVMIDFNAVS